MRDQSFHALHVGFERELAAAGQPVETPPFIFNRGSPGRFFNPSGIHEPLQGSVERPGSEPHLTVGVFEHVLEDPVAVTLAGGERQQHVKHGRGERGCHRYVGDRYIHNRYICQGGRMTRDARRGNEEPGRGDAARLAVYFFFVVVLFAVDVVVFGCVAMISSLILS